MKITDSAHRFTRITWYQYSVQKGNKCESRGGGVEARTCGEWRPGKAKEASRGLKRRKWGPRGPTGPPSSFSTSAGASVYFSLYINIYFYFSLFIDMGGGGAAGPPDPQPDETQPRRAERDATHPHPPQQRRSTEKKGWRHRESEAGVRRGRATAAARGARACHTVRARTPAGTSGTTPPQRRRRRRMGHAYGGAG